MLGTPSTSPSRLPRQWQRDRLGSKDSDDMDDEQRESLLGSGVLGDEEGGLPAEAGEGVCVQMMRMGGCFAGKARTSDLDTDVPSQRSRPGGASPRRDKLSAAAAPGAWDSKTASTSTVASSFASSQPSTSLLFSPSAHSVEYAAAAAVDLDLLPPPHEETRSESSSHSPIIPNRTGKTDSGSSRVSFKDGADVSNVEDIDDYADDQSGFSSNALTVAWQKRQNKANTYRETFGRETEDSIFGQQSWASQQHMQSEIDDDLNRGRESVMTDASEEVRHCVAKKLCILDHLNNV